MRQSVGWGERLRCASAHQTGSRGKHMLLGGNTAQRHNKKPTPWRKGVDSQGVGLYPALERPSACPPFRLADLVWSTDNSTHHPYDGYTERKCPGQPSPCDSSACYSVQEKETTMDDIF